MVHMAQTSRLKSHVTEALRWTKARRRRPNWKPKKPSGKVHLPPPRCPNGSGYFWGWLPDGCSMLQLTARCLHPSCPASWSLGLGLEITKNMNFGWFWLMLIQLRSFQNGFFDILCRKPTRLRGPRSLSQTTFACCSGILQAHVTLFLRIIPFIAAVNRQFRVKCAMGFEWSKPWVWWAQLIEPGTRSPTNGSQWLEVWMERTSQSSPTRPFPLNQTHLKLKRLK